MPKARLTYRRRLCKFEPVYLLEGTATFQTEDGTVEVGADEAVRFAPWEYQEGKNESDDRVRALAMGAPKEMGETREVPVSRVRRRLPRHGGRRGRDAHPSRLRERRREVTPGGERGVCGRPAERRWRQPEVRSERVKREDCRRVRSVLTRARTP